MVTLLVVDDDPDVLELTVTLLSEGGYRVLSAPSGGAALALLEREAVDLVVTDVVMPGMTGFELVERARQRRPDLPVIYMSAYFDAMPDGRAIRNDVFLAKPWKPRDLLRAVATTAGDDAPLG